jgi:D-3-phosphoglycerate dehydrogenase
MTRYLVIDFDSTFVQVEALDELARIALVHDPDREAKVDRIAAITHAAMNGDIGFGEALEQRLQQFQAVRADVVQLISLLQHRVTPSVQQNKEFIRANADMIFIISGGFREYILPVVQEFGISPDHVMANEFIYDRDEIIGADQDNPLAHDGGKVRALDELNFNGQVVMVGDGYSDLHTRLEGAVDYFAAFVENVERQRVKEQADLVAHNFGEVLSCLDSRAFLG